MGRILNRRHFLEASSLVVFNGCARRSTWPPSKFDREARESSNTFSEYSESPERAQSDSASSAVATHRVMELEKFLGGRVGVFAFSPGSQWVLAHRADEYFSMASTFKWALAALILEGVDDGRLSLDRPVTIEVKDLQEWAPVTQKAFQEGRVSLTLGELCAAAVVSSDNTAANLLLEEVDGPEGLTQFFRRMGDDVTRLDRNEPMLNLNLKDDRRDTTSPRAMAYLLHHILSGCALSASSRTKLRDWLTSSKFGEKRLRAGLPKGTKMGHKTGTGNRGAVNDVAVFWSDAGQPCYVASYLSGSSKGLPDLEAAHAEIAELVAALFEA